MILVLIATFLQATRKNGEKMAFYSMPEYEAWKESLGDNARGWSIKYYKVCVKKIHELIASCFYE